jgi:hypothetical protein
MIYRVKTPTVMERVFEKNKSKAVPLHAMEALGGRGV